jgi:hypothetical protein
MQSSDRPLLIFNFQSFFGTAIFSHVGTCLQLTMGVEFDGIAVKIVYYTMKLRIFMVKIFFEYEYIVQV